MKKIDWVRKLTSRKFILAVTAFVTALLYAFNYSHIEVEKIVGVISAMLVVIAYIFGEGIADAGNASTEEETYIVQGDLQKILETLEKEELK